MHSTLDAFDRATTVWTSGRTIDRTTDRTTDWTTNQQSNTTNTTLTFHHSTHDWNLWTGSGGSGGGCFEWDATPRETPKPAGHPRYQYQTDRRLRRRQRVCGRSCCCLNLAWHEQHTRFGAHILRIQLLRVAILMLTSYPRHLMGEAMRPKVSSMFSSASK
jgi:hypothetical protein